MFEKLKKKLEQEVHQKEGGLPIHKTDVTPTEGVSRDSFKDFAGKDLLIVEDNLINQKVLLTVLTTSGMNIKVANNGQEALDMVFGGNHFDLVLMDINMPVMDGFTATQKIREDNRFHQMPIVAFTALNLEDEIMKIFKCGVNAFLAKPLNIGKLYTAMHMFLLA